MAPEPLTPVLPGNSCDPPLPLACVCVAVCVLQAWQSFPHSEYQCRSSQAVIATALQQMASGGGGGSPGRAASAGQEGGATHEGAGYGFALH